MKISIAAGLTLILVCISSCINTQETSLDSFSSTYSHCIDVLDGELYGVGLSRTPEKTWHWVALEGIEVIDSTPFLSPPSREIFPTRCWLDQEMRMHFVWATHKTEAGFSPRKSDTLRYAQYDFRQNTWKDPAVIWGAPQGETFNWSFDDGPSFSHIGEMVYAAFEVSDYRFAIIKWLPDKQDWEVDFVETVEVTLSSGRKSIYRMGGPPNLLVAPDGQYFITYMNDYEIAGGGTAEMDIYLIQSNDKGLTWGEARFVSGTSMSGQERPDLWMSNNNLHLLWHERAFNATHEPGRFVHTYSSDGGLSWSTPTYFSPSGGYTLEREMCSDKSGNRYLVAGSLQPRPVDYYKWVDGGWSEGIDLTKYLIDPPTNLGMISPVVTCDTETAYVYGTRVLQIDSTLNIPSSYWRHITRLDTVRPISRIHNLNLPEPQGR